MAKQTTPLSPTLLDSLKNKDKLVRMYDGNGLILEIRALPSKKKVWRFKYPHPITKKDILLTLGEYPALSLKNARAKRSEYLAMLADKLDPREQLQIEQDKLDNATSLEKVTRLWHTEQTAKGKWGGDTGHKTLRKFENHLFPLIGELPIEEIRTHDLTKALTIIDNKGVNRVARDLRANLVRIFTFAIQHDYIRHNPARELDGLITARKVKHHPALPHHRLNELLSRIEQHNRCLPLSKLCLSLTLHLFIRSSEVRFARWSEFDLDKKQWVIPASREYVDGVRYSDRGAKMSENHLVPLSPQAIEILKEIKVYSGHCANVFPSRDDPEKFISENTVTKLLRALGYDTQTEIDGHGIRTMACGTLIQSTLFSEDAVERQMSHKERDKTRLAYTHMAEFLEERKEMMYWWSNYLERNKIGYISPHDYGVQTKLALDQSEIIQFRKV